MWLISGPFDGATSGVVDFSITKLLKPGRSYMLGRKAKHPAQIVVKHPVMSAEHSSFIVGEHSTADVVDPLVIPSLLYHNHRNKPIRITRGQETLIVNPLAQQELRDGDVIAVISGVSLTIHWRPICCLSPPVRGHPAISFEKCAALGIKIVATQHTDITHHLTPFLSLSPLLSTSMLSAAQLVRPEWLTELLRLGEPTSDDTAPGSATALESSFLLPPETKFRPPFAPTLAPPLKTFRTWEPNEARVGMLRGWVFVFVGEKGREVDKETRELVERGGGSCDLFDVAGGRTRWEQMVKKAKKKAESGKGLTLVAEEKIKRAAVRDSWDELVEVSKSFGLRFIAPANVIEAVVCVDTSRIDSSLGSDSDPDPVSAASSLPEFVPDTHPDESLAPLEVASQIAEPGPSTRRLQKRAAPTPRAISPVAPDPMVNISDVPEEPPVPQRRTLTRRAKTNKVILGIDDPSILDSQSSIQAAVDKNRSTPDPEPSLVGNSPAPTPARPARLKRRAGTTAATNSLLEQLGKELEDTNEHEVPLKKFKALFDEADPDLIASQGSSNIESQSQLALQSQTQTQTDQGRSSRTRTALRPVREEVEESQASGPVDPLITGGSKRKVHVIEGDEAERPDSQVSKRRAVENVNAVGRETQSSAKPPSTTTSQVQSQAPDRSSKPPSTTRKKMQMQKASSGAGAAPGKPDTDAAFLKALASTKKGKKNEDQFDREFNNLRISKPDVENEEQVKEWAVLEDFGDDGDLRGNFMVIVEMDVPARGGSRERRGAGGRMDWEGKPDFKKFKRKGHGRPRTAVELVVDDENDYGMGSMYWKGTSQSLSQSQSQSQGNGASYLQPSQSQNQARAKPPSKTRTQTQTQTQATRRGRSRGLLVDDSDDSEEDERPLVAKGKQKAARKGQTAGKATQSQRNTRTRTGKEQPLFLSSEDDEDDEEVQNQVMEGIDEALEDQDGESAMRSSRKAGTDDIPLVAAPSRKRKAPVLVVDDDSDTGINFKAFAGRKRARGR